MTSVEIRIPSVGESVSEGSISRWLKKDGDYVRQDELIFELETEKATQEIPSPASGSLKIGVQAGSRVAIGAVVGVIDTSVAAPAGAAASPPAPAKAPSVPSAPSPAKSVPVAAPSSPPSSSPPVPVASGVPAALSPSARRMAAEAGIDPSTLAGSGRHGVVLKEDVQRHAQQQAARVAPASAHAAPKPNGEPRETRQRMSSIRARIAGRLLASQKNTASLTTFNEVDMSAVMDLRAKFKDRFKDKHDVGLGFMSFFVKAVTDALRAYPLVNARIDAEDIVFHHHCNVGVAVSTEKGLMVPVLRDAEQLSFAEIEKQIGLLAVRARDGKISVADLEGGTFTITNGGIFGSMMSTPILNPPQSAILGMHAINKRPVVKDDQIVIRPMMYLALTYDHRLIDGREAVQFLVRVKECIEDPHRLLLEV